MLKRWNFYKFKIVIKLWKSVKNQLFNLFNFQQAQSLESSSRVVLTIFFSHIRARSEMVMVVSMGPARPTDYSRCQSLSYQVDGWDKEKPLNKIDSRCWECFISPFSCFVCVCVYFSTWLNICNLMMSFLIGLRKTKQILVMWNREWESQFRIRLLIILPVNTFN